MYKKEEMKLFFKNVLLKNFILEIKNKFKFQFSNEAIKSLVLSLREQFSIKNFNAYVITETKI